MKPWYKSTTLWMNLAFLVFDYFVPLIPPPYDVAVLAVANFIQRFRTTKAVTLR